MCIYSGLCLPVKMQLPLIVFPAYIALEMFSSTLFPETMKMTYIVSYTIIVDYNFLPIKQRDISTLTVVMILVIFIV